jgi:perosamine synthetase
MDYFVYVVELQGELRRDEVTRGLAARGVPSRGYFSPIHLQPYLQKMIGYREWTLPVTEEVASKTVALPFYNALTAGDAEYVVSALVQVLDELYCLRTGS